MHTDDFDGGLGLGYTSDVVYKVVDPFNVIIRICG
jgi:hypothetical protein